MAFMRIICTRYLITTHVYVGFPNNGVHALKLFLWLLKRCHLLRGLQECPTPTPQLYLFLGPLPPKQQISLQCVFIKRYFLKNKASESVYNAPYSTIYWKQDRVKSWFVEPPRQTQISSDQKFGSFEKSGVKKQWSVISKGNEKKNWFKSGGLKN